MEGRPSGADKSRPLGVPQHRATKKTPLVPDDPLQLRFITSTGAPQHNDASTRKLVRSHVVRNYHATRQQAWKKKEESTPESLRSALVCVCGTTDQVQESGDDASESTFKVCPYCQAPAKQVSVEPREEISAILVAGPSAREHLHLQLPNAPTTLLGASNDPFASYPIQMTPRINILVDHFLDTVGPGMNTFLTRANKNANPTKTIYLPFSIADPCVFQGLLLLSARSYAKASGDDSFHVTALACKAECFRLVNIALEDPRKATSDATIATVLMLAVEELMMGDLDAFKSHLQGLRLMISLRGGLQALGLNGILEQLALSCDHACMIFTGSKPFFDDLDNVPRIQPAMMIPPGFQEIMLSPSTNPSLTSILLGATSGTLVKTFSGFEGTTPFELAFVDGQCKLIENHLATLGHWQTKIGLEIDSAAVEVCVCLGIWAYHTRMLRSIPPSLNSCSQLGHRLYAALMPYRELVGWHDHRLLLWIVFIGAQATLEGTLRYWFMQFFRDVGNSLGKKSWKQNRDVLKKFFWIDRCEKYGRVLWSELENFTPEDLWPSEERFELHGLPAPPE